MPNGWFPFKPEEMDINMDMLRYLIFPSVVLYPSCAVCVNVDRLERASLEMVARLASLVVGGSRFCRADGMVKSRGRVVELI